MRAPDIFPRAPRAPCNSIETASAPEILTGMTPRPALAAPCRRRSTCSSSAAARPADAAAQLSAFPGIVTRIVELKSGPLQLGQADGIACRTMEMFQAFGFRERVEREAYWVNETVFWKPDEEDRSRIRRHGRIQDVEDGLAPYPHVILKPGARA